MKTRSLLSFSLYYFLCLQFSKMKRKNNTGMICYPYEEIIKLDPFLTSYKKLILGGLKTNNKLQNLETSRKKYRNICLWHWSGKNFLNKTEKNMNHNGKHGYILVYAKKFVYNKKYYKQSERPTTVWEKLPATKYSCPQYMRNLHKSVRGKWANGQRLGTGNSKRKPKSK